MTPSGLCCHSSCFYSLLAGGGHSTAVELVVSAVSGVAVGTRDVSLIVADFAARGSSA